MTDKINILKIRELRKRTGVGIVECKEALIRSQGNIEQSIDYLRTLGYAKVLKRIHCEMLHGSIFIHINDNKGVMLELNCETDFVANSKEFITFGQQVLSIAALNSIKEIDELRNICKNEIINFMNKVNENVCIRRLFFLENKNFISYLHGTRIGVFVIADNIMSDNRSVIKKIAMHIAFSKPEFLTIEEIPSKIINREYSIQSDIVTKMNKPKIVFDKIIQGKMNRFKEEITLLEQFFVMEPKKRIKQVLQENNLVLSFFKRFEVGELL
ncbi:elongation factor Ts [Buchnera aphidicola (Nipponaphis monzeni)]|uniref:Elongation factor Ts n=1 Tax=Buchnera aphidicola (Nipponaphis monzeni) TaxID=2495405 RepID=A0A455TA12_9GAMM|nr:translation elongation factor Ts [Buchnera aphidicola]BBI01197.1 elongation factor Ts [Buchnera aphidicola (Nipponaphis monzeni)]